MALLVLVLAAWWTVRLAWADHLSYSPHLRDRQTAARLAPFDSAISARLAEALSDAAADPLPALQAAVRSDPENPQWRMQLGQFAELAGDFPLAESSFLEAARLSRLYQPKYLLAGYYFRRGNADQCIRWSRASLALAPADAAPVLQLLGALWNPAEMAAEALRQPPAVARQFLLFLSARGPDPAGAALARDIAFRSTAEDLPALLGYANLLLAQGRAADAVELWNALAVRRLLPYPPLNPAAGQSLTNADFERDPLFSGFDWHAEAVPGVRAVSFSGALHAGFSGRQPDDSVVVWEYVPLQSGIRYRLRSEVRAPDASDGIGLTWKLFYPAPSGVWLPLADDLTRGFRAPAEVGRLALLYRRTSGVPRLEGDVEVTGLRLEREP